MRDLGGMRILLTRTEAGCAAWGTRIEAAGGTPVAFPCIRVETLDDSVIRARLDRLLPTVEWVTLSSRRGVSALAALHPALRPDLRIAVVGDATAAAAREAWGRIDLVAADGTAASLAAALLERLPTARAGSARSPRVATIAAANGMRHIEGALQDAGIVFVRTELYRVVWRPQGGSDERPLDDRVDVALLASPSAVRGLVARAKLPADVRVITIGPTTSTAAREAGLHVTAEARERCLDGLLEAIP